MRDKAKYEDYSITLFYMYISLYRLILKSDRANAYKMTRYVRELYSQSQRLVRQSSCHLSGKRLQKCNIGPLRANYALRKRKIEDYVCLCDGAVIHKTTGNAFIKKSVLFYVFFYDPVHYYILPIWFMSQVAHINSARRWLNLFTTV